MKKLCSRCVRILRYLIQYPQMLKPYHKCINCGSDRQSWSEDAIIKQIKILEKRNGIHKQTRYRWDQDEMRFDDLVNGTTTWQDAIIAIKNKYPKGE